MPLSAGTQPHEFLNAYECIFNKLKTFNPEFILLSAGFDAHKDDPLAQINLESKDYYTLTNRILILAKKLCDGKVVSILEGGYDLRAIKESSEMHVNALLEFEGMNVSASNYIQGLGDAIGEWRRKVLDSLRKLEIEEGEKYLAIMEASMEIFNELDYPDALTGGLRRYADTARAIIERTRSDLTNAIVSESLRKELKNK